MNNNIKKLSGEIFDIISQAAQIAVKNSDNSNDALINFLDLSENELHSVIEFVVHALPQGIFLDKNKEIRSYARELVAKELILFLAQEDKRSKEFSNNIKNFRNEMTSEIVNNVLIQV